MPQTRAAIKGAAPDKPRPGGYRNEFQIPRNDFQIWRNNFKVPDNKIQIRRNKIQIQS
jgi:hypothetical protein